MRLRVVFLLLLGTSLASAVACSLNPQPLPPYTGAADAGATPDASQFGGGSDASEDTAVTPLPPDAGSADAGETDASADARDEGDASSASDAQEDGDSSSDATDDGDGG